MKDLTTILFAAGAMSALLLFPLSGASFRVESSSGVPQLTRDGVPVRSRMFWGHTFYSAGSTELRPDWSVTSFEFPAYEDCSVGALHLRFGEETGSVFFQPD